MAQYIDKSALLAEIDKRIKVLQKQPHENHKTICHLDSLKQYLNTLEVKEVENMPNIRFPHYEDIVEKVFGAGNLEFFEHEQAEQLVSLAKEELLKDLEVKDDTFIEKACEWLRYNNNLIDGDVDDYVDDFRKYMKEE